MSDFLLQKGFKLLLENKHNKRTKSEKQRLKKKKNCLNLKLLQEEEFKNNILKNLKKLEEFSEKSTVDVSEKILTNNKSSSKTEENIFQKEEEEEGGESTVFTEKDFEDFEKEYFDS